MKNSILILVAFLIATTGLLAQTSTLNIQGVLRDDENKAVSDGKYDISFRLYTEATGGAEIWEEDQSVDITNGVYSALLGNTTSLEELGFNTQYYLGIAVESGSELSPRIPLSLSPFSKAVVGSDNVFPSTGTVGVGTISPNSDAALHVSGGNLLVSDANFALSNANIKLDGNWISGDGNNEGIFVNTNGEVGIGISNPSYDLEVAGPFKTGRIIQFDTESASNYTFDVWVQGGSDATSGSTDNRNLALVGNSTLDILYVNFNGEYKQGTVMGSRTLGEGGFITSRIKTNFGGSIRYLGASRSDGGNANQVSGYKFAGDNDTGMFSYEDGRISFFTNDYEAIIIEDGFIYCGKFGNCGLGNNWSDRRLKSDIAPYTSPSPLKNIARLQPKTFHFNFVDAEPLSYGLIAQEVQKIIPHAVKNSHQNKVLEDGTEVEDALELDYDAITLELIMAVQELTEKVERLAAENETLKLRLAAMSEYVPSSSTLDK